MSTPNRAVEDPSIDGANPSWNQDSIMIDARGRPIIKSTKAQERGNLIVHFHKGELIDAAETKRAGRPKYKSVDMITLITPGDKDNILCREVWDDPMAAQSDVVRFRAEWEHYKKSGEVGPDNVPGGHTPLDKAPFIPRAQVLELRHLNIYTVEQLAGLTDGNCQKYMGVSDLRQQARDYIAAAEGASGMFSLRAENDEMRAQLAQMREQLDQVARRQALGGPDRAQAKKSHHKKAPPAAEALAE